MRIETVGISSQSGFRGHIESLVLMTVEALLLPLIVHLVQVGIAYCTVFDFWRHRCFVGGRPDVFLGLVGQN